MFLARKRGINRREGKGQYYMRERRRGGGERGRGEKRRGGGERGRRGRVEKGKREEKRRERTGVAFALLRTPPLNPTALLPKSQGMMAHLKTKLSHVAPSALEAIHQFLLACGCRLGGAGPVE